MTRKKEIHMSSHWTIEERLVEACCVVLRQAGKQQAMGRCILVGISQCKTKIKSTSQCSAVQCNGGLTAFVPAKNKLNGTCVGCIFVLLVNERKFFFQQNRRKFTKAQMNANFESTNTGHQTKHNLNADCREYQTQTHMRKANAQMHQSKC